jgi:hypothetical protein
VNLVAVHLAATWFMVGLIWLVQTVHYPLLAAVGKDAFPEYEHGHTQRITRLLAVAAGAEIVTALALVVATPGEVEQWAAWLAGGLLAAAWVVTRFVQVPIHRSLSSGYDAVQLQRLVATNWVRTVLWSARGVAALVFLI